MEHGHVGGICSVNFGIIYRCINKSNLNSSGEAAAGIAAQNGNRDSTGETGAPGFVIECINQGKIYAGGYNSAGIVAENASWSNHSGVSYWAYGFICNSYNEGIISGGWGQIAGIVADSGYGGGSGYIFNCYNKIARTSTGGVDYLWRGGSTWKVENCSNDTDGANITTLNTKVSDIPDLLTNTGLYRENAWVKVEDEIFLDWEIENL